VAVEGLSARPYLDQNVNPQLAVDLRRHGFAATFAREVGNERLTDEEHLQWASERGQVLISFDVKDFPVLANRWADEGRTHAGIILLTPPEFSYGKLFRRLLRLLDTLTGDDLVDRVEWLDGRWDIVE
jgi:predicted nuclease of predicted toxin-antitoxin system